MIGRSDGRQAFSSQEGIGSRLQHLLLDFFMIDSISLIVTRENPINYMRQQVVDSMEAEGELSSLLLMLNVSIIPISFILQYHMLPRSNYLKPWLQESNSKFSIGKKPSNKKIEINFNLTETRARIYIYIYKYIHIYIYIFFFFSTTIGNNVTIS